jgi:hypothetical protein
MAPWLVFTLRTAAWAGATYAEMWIADRLVDLITSDDEDSD